MKKILSIAPLAALLLCGCPVPNKNSGMIVATKVIQATGGSTGSTCTYSTDTLELTFGAFNPLAGGYTHGLVLENRLPDNSNLGPGRVNTNDFQVEYAIIDYGQIDGPAVVLPEQAVPGNALITTGSKGVTQLNLVPVAVAQAIGGNTMRFGSSCRSTDFSWTGPGCIPTRTSTSSRRIPRSRLPCRPAPLPRWRSPAKARTRTPAPDAIDSLTGTARPASMRA